MTLPVEIEVYEKDNSTLVCSLTHNDAEPDEARQVVNLSGKTQREGDGDGTLVVDVGHPQASELIGGRFIQVKETVDDTPRVPLTFRIRTGTEVRIPPPGSGSSKRLITIKGDGPRRILKFGRVLPWLPVGWTPTSNRRRFGPESPGLDTSDWTDPFTQLRLTSEPGKPFGMPDVFGDQWIDAEEEDDVMTVGDRWFRREFIFDDTAAQLDFMASWDDRGAQYLHGVELQAVDPAFPDKVWHKPWRAPTWVEPMDDPYLYAARASNDGGKAAFMNETWVSGPDGISTMLFLSGVPNGGDYDELFGEWLCYIGPAGEWFTPGEIIRILLDECHARGELLDVTRGCTDLLDSAGEPWDKIEAEFDATGTLLDAMKVLEASWIDFDVSNTDGLVLDAWKKDPGRGTAVSIDVTSSAAELTEDSTTTEWEQANDVLLAGEKDQWLYESPLAVLAYGRLPGGVVNVGKIKDQPTLDRIGAEYLAPRLEPQESRVIGVSPLLELPAAPGDTISVEGVAGQRIEEIGFQLGKHGLLKAPALSTPAQERKKRSDRIVELLIRQYGETLGSARALDLGTGIEPGPVENSPLEEWTWDIADMLDPEYWAGDEDNPRAWQTYTVKDATRLVGMIVRADWADQEEDEVPFQCTTGQSRFVLLRNGLPTSPPFIATLPETNVAEPSNPQTWAISFILGPALVNPLETLSVSCIENGGHINGTVEVLGTKGV